MSTAKGGHWMYQEVNMNKYQQQERQFHGTCINGEYIECVPKKACNVIHVNFTIPTVCMEFFSSISHRSSSSSRVERGTRT